MSEEFKDYLKSKERHKALDDEIIEMDREINRNTFFTMKCLFKSLEKPELANKMGMSNVEIFLTWELVKLLESIADKIKMLADVVCCHEVLVKKDATDKFMDIYNDIEANFKFVMEQYFKKSKEGMHQVFKEVQKNEERCNNFLREYKEGWTPLLLDHLKDINMFTRGIADLMVDFD